MYHKPPESFLGQGRFGAEAMQKAAIEEQKELARENPIAAAAAAAAVAGGSAPQQNTMENLLDIDFDGAAPASLQKQPTSGASGLEGLGGTPQRIASPVANTPGSAGAMGGLDDLMGAFGNANGSATASATMSPASGVNDLMNGFESLNMGAGNQPPPPQEQMGGQQQKKTNEDLLGMF